MRLSTPAKFLPVKLNFFNLENQETDIKFLLRRKLNFNLILNYEF